MARVLFDLLLRVRCGFVLFGALDGRRGCYGGRAGRPMVAWRSLALSAMLACCLLVDASMAAEAPKIERLFPPGLQRGTTTTVKLVGKAGDGPLRVWSDSDQLSLQISEKQDTAELTAAADMAPGLHWLRFYNDHGATELLPCFVGLIPEAEAAEPHNDVSTAQPVELPSVTVNGVLEKSEDVDLFAVSLTAGQTLVASVQAGRELGSPMDAVLQVLDPAGTVVAFNDDDHGFDPQIVYTAPRDGSYFIRIFAFPATPNSTIRMAGGATYVYRLTLTTEAFIDHVRPAMVDPTKESNVAVHGWNLSDEQRQLTIPGFTTDFTSIGDGFANAHQLKSCHHPSLVESSEQPQTLPVPATVSGCISAAGETDSFTIAGTKGLKLTIEVAGRSLSSVLDPVVAVLDESGKVLKEADDRSRGDLDTDLAVTLKADGLHTITVTDRYGSGGERYFYALTCRETVVDFALTVKSNSFVLPTDKPLEIPVAVSRNNGFADAISVSMTGLPAGVTAAVVQSAKDGDTSKSVTLKIERGQFSEGFSGLIAISGRVRESESVTLATAPVPNTSTPTTQIWLTIPKVSEEAAEAEKAAK
ncbi:MAG: PPC domain-containing protein [Fuerstiella sp.]